MRVLIPHHESAPKVWTQMWARHWCPDAVKVHTPGHYRYAEQIREWWNEREPFIVVEHDIVPWPGAVESLADCSEPWCAFSYGPHEAFIRYGSVPMGMFKVVPKELGTPPLSDDPVHWSAIDSVVAQKLFERGHMVHQHWPAVANLNGDYPVNSEPIRERELAVV